MPNPNIPSFLPSGEYGGGSLKGEHETVFTVNQEEQTADAPYQVPENTPSIYDVNQPEAEAPAEAIPTIYTINQDEQPKAEAEKVIPNIYEIGQEDDFDTPASSEQAATPEAAKSEIKSTEPETAKEKNGDKTSEPGTTSAESEAFKSLKAEAARQVVEAFSPDAEEAVAAEGDKAPETDKSAAEPEKEADAPELTSAERVAKILELYREEFHEELTLPSANKKTPKASDDAEPRGIFSAKPRDINDIVAGLNADGVNIRQVTDADVAAAGQPMTSYQRYLADEAEKRAQKALEKRDRIDSDKERVTDFLDNTGQRLRGFGRGVLQGLAWTARAPFRALGITGRAVAATGRVAGEYAAEGWQSNRRNAALGKVEAIESKQKILSARQKEQRRKLNVKAALAQQKLAERGQN